jgi:hypothetical protein
MRDRVVAVLVIAALATGAWVVPGEAAFAASENFSGRYGFTCQSCHGADPLTPSASVFLEGLPEAWQPGESYLLTLRVEGGPPPAPELAPQGGFELDTDGGTLHIPDGREDLLRRSKPHQMTYLPEGTLMRQWQVEWRAPDLTSLPGLATLWLAGMAANGNHNIQLNLSTGGERGDAVATLRASVPPVPEAMEMWRAMPLLPPRTDQGRYAPDHEGTVHIQGSHADGNATTLAWRFADGEPWQRRDTGPEWRLQVPDLRSGTHALQLRSEGSERVSSTTVVILEVPGGFLDRATPAPAWLAAAALLFIALLLRRKQ